MSTTPLLSLIATGCLVLAAYQNGQAADTAARLATVEKEVAEMKAVFAEHEKAMGESRALAEKTARYLSEQAKAAAQMQHVLDESEKAGFTFGINPDSRILLLAGWHEALAAAQKDVPQPVAPPVLDKNGATPRNGSNGQNKGTGPQ
jgi:hypothetical protein